MLAIWGTCFSPFKIAWYKCEALQRSGTGKLNKSVSFSLAAPVIDPGPLVIIVRGFDDGLRLFPVEFREAVVFCEVSADGKNSSDFGFDDPQATVTITYEDETTAKIIVGDKAPTNAGIYIKGGDEDMKFTDLKECYYRQGNIITGDPVRVIQSVVKPIDGVDGSFGPNTRDAVIRFQKANGLNPDGIVGAKTWEKIYSKCE